MEVRLADWWPELMGRVASEPLADLAHEYGVDLASVEAGLAAEPADGPVTESVWWPEACRRIEAGGSLRQVARSFGTNPRRVRRGLARSGLRAGGRDLSEGVPELQAHLARLGKEPDVVIARDAGVAVEAVKGERRRLKIEAYRPVGREREEAASGARDEPSRLLSEPIELLLQEVFFGSLETLNLSGSPSSARLTPIDDEGAKQL